MVNYLNKTNDLKQSE